MKKMLIVLITLILTILFCSCSENQYISTFNNYKNDFDQINNLIISNSNMVDEKISFGVEKDGDEIVGLYGLSVQLVPEYLISLNEIDNAFQHDFSFIELSKQRVSYGGNGSEMYVYSIDGSYPKYFYYENDGMRFSVTKLSDNWYYLKSK